MADIADPRRPGARSRSAWRMLGLILAGVLETGGLVVVAVIVVVIVGLASWGHNK